MKKYVNLLLSSLLVSSFLYADDFDDDFDSEFGSTTQAQVSSDDDFDSEFGDDVEEKPKKSYSLNFSGSLKVRGYGFIENTNYKKRNNNRVQSDGVLELNSKFKKGNYIISSSLFSTIGTEHNTYSYDKVFDEFRDMNKEVPIAGIKEFYGIRSSDNYDIILGKKVFKVGVSTLYSPSDIYNLALSPDPLDPYTIGVWLGEFEYYTENSSYGIVFFPVISNSKTFSPRSRWSGNDSQSNSNNFIVPANAKIILDKENAVRVLLKFKSTQILFDNGIDIMMDVGYGPSLYTILAYTDEANVYEETHPNVFYTSLGFSTTYKKLEVHGEAYYQHSISSRDDNFISAVGGATYTLDKFVDKVGFNKIDMTVEYVKEIKTNSYNEDITYRPSEKQRAPKNDILVKVDAEINHKWSLTYFGNFRLEIEQNKDSGRYQKFGTKYTIIDGFVGEFAVETFNGDTKSYYGKWQDNDRVILQFTYSF